jgi:DNA repair protein RadC
MRARREKKTVLRVRDLPAGERPREKLMFSGEHALSHEELIALVLGSGHGRVSVLALAREVLSRAGGLGGLGELDARELTRLPGLGSSLACRLVAALALGRRALDPPLAARPQIATPRRVFQHLSRRTRGLKKEVFYALYLDGKNRCLREEVVSQGTLEASLVHPREVFRTAIRTAASGVIVAHNHPSGDPTPSPEDLDVSHRLLRCGRLLGIRLVDHVILGSRSYVSLREAGMFDLNGGADDCVAEQRRAIVDRRLLDVLRCPHCEGAIDGLEGEVICPRCERRYPLRYGMPFLQSSERRGEDASSPPSIAPRTTKTPPGS